ncbi:MAG TPA: ROK family transcriptional regulator [Micromonosporaceae bacterium]
MLATKPDSAGHLLWLVRTGHGRTCGQLEHATGLSRSTVVQRLNVLLAAGLVRVNGVTGSTGGRPAQRWEFNPQHGVLLAAALGADRARAAVLDVGGRVLAGETAPAGIATRPERAARWVGLCFEQLLSATGWKPEQVRGVGIGTPSLTDGQAIADVLQSIWDCPVRLDSVADLMALGEHAANHPECRVLVLVDVGAAIAAGMVVGGAIHRGDGAVAGDLGHVRLPALADARCDCGSYGCLAAGASARAIARRLTVLGVPTRPGPGLTGRLRQGHPDALRLVRTAGGLVGEVLSPALSLVVPGVLVVTGDLAERPFLAGLREALHERMSPRAARSLRLTTGRLGSNAYASGVHQLLVDQVYAPAAVDTRLAAGLS